jgi:hypothetical protein
MTQHWVVKKSKWVSQFRSLFNYTQSALEGEHWGVWCNYVHIFRHTTVMCNTSFLYLVFDCGGICIKLLIQIEHYFHTRFPTWSSIFMMHVEAWDQHQYQQLGTRFHGYLLFIFCRYASGDLVEPMSLWSASECIMLVFVLSPSHWLIQVVVGDVHLPVFFRFVSWIKCKTFNRVPRREASAGCCM